jgi:multidrug efflux pump subunit AcrB
MGQGGLGGAAPAYLQSQAAEQAADIAQKRRLNELYGGLDKAQREEAMAAATGMTSEQARQRGLAGTVGGQMYSAQTQGLASLETEKERAKNDMARQTLLINSNEKIAQMSKDTQERIAQLDRDMRVRLHSTPSASIDSVAIANYVAAGLSPTDAYERVRALTSGFRGEMTRDQAEDNVRKDISEGVYMSEIRDAQKKAKESGVPFDMEAWKRKKVEALMSTSGRNTIGGSKQPPPGFVPDQPGR